MLEYLTQNAVVIMGIMGFLAFVINIIVEMTKELPVIKKMPTKAYVLIVSVVVCVLAIIIYAAVVGMQLQWYYIVLAIFGAFIIGYLAIYGWDTLKELYDRYKK